MKHLLRIQIKVLIPFLTITFLLFLTSRYFGGVYIRVFRFWISIFLADFLLLLANRISLRYSQQFTHKHVQKGEIVQYNLNISGWGFLPVPSVTEEFSRIHQRDKQVIPKQNFSIKPNSRHPFSCEIYAGLRGVYTMGLSRLSITGFTGLITLDLPIWAKTFYVYPRLIRLQNHPLQKHQPTEGQSATLTGNRGEAHTFSNLKEYRAGENTRFISWSRFSQLGRPILREFDTRGGAGVHIFLDRRPVGRSPLCEDTVIEAALALINSAFQAGQQVTVHGFPGWENREIISEAEINRLLNSTLSLEFNAKSLAELDEIPEGTTLYVISAISDWFFLDSAFWFNQPSGHLIAVTEDMSAETLLKTRRLIAYLQFSRNGITEITANHRLEEELPCVFFS
ncbi:MAG: DUF58 domain-containing protein [Spirochaetes bacterium]|nr:DUF58 domain-containing protein [Spirochaetota bacterium]